MDFTAKIELPNLPNLPGQENLPGRLLASLPLFLGPWLAFRRPRSPLLTAVSLEVFTVGALHTPSLADKFTVSSPFSQERLSPARSTLPSFSLVYQSPKTFQCLMHPSHGVRRLGSERSRSPFSKTFLATFQSEFTISYISIYIKFFRFFTTEYSVAKNK